MARGRKTLTAAVAGTLKASLAAGRVGFNWVLCGPMSLPSYLYKCSACERSFTSDDTSGHFSYQASDGFRFPLEQTGGWCYDCDRHVPVEDLRTDGLLKDIESLRQRIPKNVGFFKSLSPSFKHDTKLLTDQLESLERRLDLIKRRSSPPKCLSCGSSEIVVLPAAGRGCYFPGCNGTLHADGEPIQISLVFDHRIYDSEGLLIQVIEDW